MNNVEITNPISSLCNIEFEWSLRVNIVVIGPITAHVMDLGSINPAVAGIIDQLDAHIILSRSVMSEGESFCNDATAVINSSALDCRCFLVTASSVSPSNIHPMSSFDVHSLSSCQCLITAPALRAPNDSLGFGQNFAF